MNEPGQCLYEFDLFRLDVVKRQLLRGGEIVPLTSKAFDVLLILVQHRGKTVSKDELMDAVWFDAVVEENNLTQQISALRKVLGERATEHRFIVTVSGRGYSFIAPVKEISGTEATEIVLQEFTKSSVTIDIYDDKESEMLAERQANISSLNRKSFLRQHRVSVMAFAALLLVLVAVAFVWILRQTNSPTSPTPKAIAVLPFKSLNENEKDELLGAGMSDTLTAKLGNLQNLTVRPTSAVSKYAGQNNDVLAVGRELKVDAVLEGTIQRNGDRMRVTVQMLDVESGKIIWGQSFDEKFSDIFSVQDAISEDVAQVLQLKLSNEEQKGIRKHSTDNIEAYQAYLRGRHFWNKRDKDGLNKGIEYFQKAVSLDPHYALAYSGIADSYLILNYYQMSNLSCKETIEKARQATLKALGIDNALAEAHTSLAFIYSLEENSQAAEKEFKRAIESNPNYATAHHWYSDFLAMNGRDDEAMKEIIIAVNLDPVSPIINTTLGERFYYSHRYDEAIAQLRQTIEMNNKFSQAHYVLGMAYEQKGMFEEAIEEYQKARSQMKESAEFDSMLARIYALSGKRKEAERILEGLLRYGTNPYAIAIVYEGMNEKSTAIEWLKKVDIKKKKWFLKVDPRLDSLRSNSEFQRLLS